MKNNYLQQSIPILIACPDIEIIVIDSFSTDGTIEFLNQFQIKIIQVKTQSRAKRLNIGIQYAIAPMVLLHHPRSLLTVEGINYLNKNQMSFYWGAFTHKFDRSHFLLKFTSFYSNYIRGPRGIYYLDHCIFARKSLLEDMDYIPEVDIFEDTELSLALNKQAKPVRLPFLSLTSATRFNKNGIIKQIYLNQVMKWKYYLKIDHKIMNKEYEKDISLNANYKENNNES